MMTEANYAADNAIQCAGCVDAAAYGQAISIQLAFQAASLWYAARNHGSFLSVIEAGKHLYKHAKRQIDEGFTHRPHTCDDAPQRCQSCLLPLIFERCMNACCGFHNAKLFQKDRWLLLGGIPADLITPADKLLLDVSLLRQHATGNSIWPHSVYVRMNGELVIVTPCIQTQEAMDEITQIEMQAASIESPEAASLQL